MRITLVTETYFPQINGVSRALGRLVDHLVSQGDRVQLIIPRYSEEDPEGAFPPGTETVRLKGLSFPFYKEVKLIFCRGARLRQHLRAFQPDVVHIATEGPLGKRALKSVRQLGSPLVTSFHTNFPAYLGYYKLGFLKNYSWKYLRRFHNAGRATFCPTMSIKEELEAHGFENVVVWARGVDCEHFSPARRREAVRRELGLAGDQTAALYVGRIADEKNLKTLFDALEHLSHLNGEFKLIMVGDGPARQRLAGRAGEKVVFTGYKRGAELADIYAAADFFVFPSVTDTFGNVILEGMASGLPAIGFDAPGPRDIIRHGETGLVAGEETAVALAGAMEQLIGAAEDREQMSLQARQYAESCQWSRINSVVRDAYASASTRRS